MSNAVWDLDRLLDRERQLLLAGDIDNLEPITSEKSDLMDRLIETQDDVPDSVRQKLN